MDAGRYLKIIWMYIIGLVLIFTGLYMIAFASSGPGGFTLMIAGFFFCMVGGVYGKKKLMEMEGHIPATMDSRQMNQIKQNVVSQLKPVQSAEMDPSGEEPRPQPQPKSLPKGQQKHQPVVQPIPQVMIQEPMQEPMPANPEVKGRVVKVMVCPACGVENPPKNMYCWNCGRRLKPEKKLKSGKKR